MGTKVCSGNLSFMTKMAGMPISDFQKFSSQEQNCLWSWTLVGSIGSIIYSMDGRIAFYLLILYAFMLRGVGVYGAPQNLCFDN